jgi:hypothetical protein
LVLAGAIVLSGLPFGVRSQVGSGSDQTQPAESLGQVALTGLVGCWGDSPGFLPSVVAWLCRGASVPAPDPPANCTGKSLQPGHMPDVTLTVDGAEIPGVLGTITIGESAGSPSAIPAEVVSMKAGELFTVRPTDGSCGNDWSGLYFLPVPDTLAGPIANLSGLPSNNGGPQNAPTPPLVGAIRGIAPAPGEWLVGAIFWFGGPDAPCYYWRISVH